MAGTFIISKVELKRMLGSFGISDKNVEAILTNMDKTHKHVNAVAFAGMLQGYGLREKEITNVLRRIGIDDISITNIFDSLDQEKIRNAFGKAVELVID
ncbi:MAG: hypothetical protein KGH72_01770 [Candidatus Micrarchaeota archaeon]|nr:hypothetical protein [Candidatus Micrarchaeota archaeon]